MYTGERATAQPMLNVTLAQGAAAYRFVRQYTRGKIVLDVACGEGYGAASLAETSKEVLAVDRDTQTVAGAAERYHRPNLVFLSADLADLPTVLRGRRFDVVCSFQFIEHLADQAAFLRTLRSLAVPGGTVVVSTPNKLVFPTFNPYHVQEVDRAEFEALFADGFSGVQVFGVFGDSAVLRYRESKQRLGDLLLRADLFRFRDRLPRPVIRRVYDAVSFLVLKRVSFWRHRELVGGITPENFSVRADGLEKALDFVAVASVPSSAP